MRDRKLIQMYITNMCNSMCKTCSIWKNKERQELLLEQIKKIVEPFKESADFVVGGGEAILHSDIENVLSYLKSSNANYTLLSNCIMNERLKDLIFKYDVKNVTVSFDGIYHDEIRGTAKVKNKEKIIDFVEWAKRNYVNFKLSYTFSCYNEKSFLKDMDFIKSLDIDKVYFCLAQNMDLLKTGTDDVVAQNLKEILERKSMLFEKDLNFITNLIEGKKKKCDSQTTVFTVYSDGSLVRCQSYLSKDVICNVNNCSKEQLQYIIENNKKITCPYDDVCNLLCQRRYDNVR